MKFSTRLFQFLKISHNNISTGNCDFCEREACIGAKLVTDVFYLCELHKCELQKNSASK